ncbi:bifunctional methylenetetrahydrofolate dehydrogenase/methenyltetrahydrofolate cyclohydrolase [Pelosinus sp. Bkl1]|uniref:Bifunctional protein FolD n=2 Tax=Pelosinus baikalensis TaxID=2892015 RepID=A0ABS8HYU6_9FIRM|nr:bifunctional methylenetetrahydrofolate dehydrogenase/methenyltetrahydrofolate cyclohydrolase [Pelosinus baikalensis]
MLNMSAKFLSGQPIADYVLEEVRRDVELLKQSGINSGLGTILVGNDSASLSYVKKKHETCKSLGIQSFHIGIPNNGTQQELLDAVSEFNQNPNVHGFLIQNPVPKGFDFNKALELIDPAKDADGLHPYNLGKLVLQEDGPIPCTPAGILEILEYYNLDIQGKEVVIIGRGTTLGRPLSLLLSMKRKNANAVVTVLHSGVSDVAKFTLRADVIISAIGVPSFVKPEMVKSGAIVLSGGISWDGKKLLPDVDESVAEVAGWITPRIGGVGPTTVAMLFRNTLNLAKKQCLPKCNLN